MINANSTYNTVDSTSITADNYSISCYLVGTGNRDLNSPLNWSSTSGGTPADVLGSELITNAADREFSSDTGYWIRESGIAIIDGVCRFSSTPNANRMRKANLTINKYYVVTFTVLNYITGALQVEIGTSNYVVKITANGTYTHYLKATSTDFNFRAVGVSTFDVDNVSIQEVLSVPNSSNPAIIDANSSIANGDVLSLSAQFDCGGFDCSAAAYTFTLSNAAYAFNVYGDLKDSTKRVNGFSSTGYLYIKGNCNIYSNGATQGWNRIYFDAVGATFTNQDDWDVGNTAMRLANGTFDSNSKNNYWGSLTTDVGTKTLILYNNILSVRTWNNLNPTNFTFNYATSTVIITVAGNLVGSNSFYNLTINLINSTTFDNNNIIHNQLSLYGSNSSNSRLLVSSNTIGTPRTITVNGSIVASNVDFRDITLAGTANRDLSAITGGSGDCGGNSGITFTPAIDCYIKHTSGAMNVSDATKWVTTDGGTTQARVPLMQDRAWGTANSFTGTATINMNCPRIGSIDLSGVNQAVTFALANHIECYGNYVLGNNITQSGDFNNLFYGRGNYDIKAYGKTLYYLAINAPTGILNFTSDITIRRSYDARGGTINHNTSHIIASYLQWYGTTTFNLDDSLIELTELGLAGNIIDSNATITINKGNSTIYFNPINRTNDLIASLSSKTFNKLIFSGQHTGNFIITGNNTFNELIIEKGRKVQITGGSTQTISPTGKLTADGTPTEQITIGSTNTTPFNLVYAGTGFHQVNYGNISYCNATANRFYAGTNSTNGGNNTGWIFKSYLAQNIHII